MAPAVYACPVDGARPPATADEAAIEDLDPGLLSSIECRYAAVIEDMIDAAVRVAEQAGDWEVLGEAYMIRADLWWWQCHTYYQGTCETRRQSYQVSSRTMKNRSTYTAATASALFGGATHRYMRRVSLWTPRS